MEHWIVMICPNNGERFKIDPIFETWHAIELWINHVVN